MSPGADEAAPGDGTDLRGLPLPGWLLDKSSDSITRRHTQARFFKLENRGTQQKVMRKNRTAHRSRNLHGLQHGGREEGRARWKWLFVGGIDSISIAE
jgi:hypothetical protein